jgi:serine/threonine protein kinase
MDDELDDYKLDAIWGQDPGYVVHTSFERNCRHRGRKVRTEKKWYRQRELGFGSCGDVHLETTDDGQERAVKSIQKSWASRLRIDYKRELAAISTFSKAKYQQHQIFVEFLGWFENPESIFVAMEYFPLGDLGKHILEDIKEHDMKNISTQLLDGLKLMHSKASPIAI